jgi:hypothetical protein
MRSKLRPTEENLNEKFLIENADVVDWDYVFIHMDLENASDDFLMRFAENINFPQIVLKNNLIFGDVNSDFFDRVSFLLRIKNKINN